jgi:hypothetical protein
MKSQFTAVSVATKLLEQSALLKVLIILPSDCHGFTCGYYTSSQLGDELLVMDVVPAVTKLQLKKEMPWILKENNIGKKRQEGVLSFKYNEKLVACHSAHFFSLGD